MNSMGVVDRTGLCLRNNAHCREAVVYTGHCRRSVRERLGFDGSDISIEDISDSREGVAGKGS